MGTFLKKKKNSLTKDERTELLKKVDEALTDDELAKLVKALNIPLVKKMALKELNKYV